MPQLIPLEFSQINPYIRYVQSLQIRRGDYPSFSRSYDCRLFYVCSGSGSLVFESEIHSLKPGDMLFWQANTAYHFDAIPKNDPLSLLGANFDLTHNHSGKNYPIPPELSNSFQEEKVHEIIQVTDVPELNTVVYLENMYLMESYLREMLREYNTKRIFYRKHLTGLFLYILSEIARKSSLNDIVSEHAEHQVESVIEYIHQYYSQPLTNQMLGELFNYHPNYLNKQMVLYTGKSLHQYLITYRISQAIRLLESTSLPVSEISSKTGFQDFCHFSKIFKQKTGHCPTDFRRSQAGAVDWEEDISP